MIFRATPIQGVFVIEPEPLSDERGFFSRTFCAREFKALGLAPVSAQSNIAYNNRKGTVRGMHYQLPPAAEAKLVRCTGGSIYDVVVDLRPASPSYLMHFGLELSSRNRRALYVPPLCAHGYQTLTDEAEVFYQVSEFYAPGHERGARFNDPALGIEWPLPVSLISEKDRTWPLLTALRQPA
jgi:dTDP-4-dehydrorhamnose 3,5-epimerase